MIYIAFRSFTAGYFYTHKSKKPLVYEMNDSILSRKGHFNIYHWNYISKRIMCDACKKKDFQRQKETSTKTYK